MNRRFFLIIFILVPLVVIGFLFFRGRGKKAPPPPAQGSPEASLAPEQGRDTQPQNAPQALTDRAVISPILSFGGDTVWYGGADGRLYRVSLLAGSGEQEYRLPEFMASLAAIEWQADGSNFIFEQNLAGHIRYQFYDADQSRFVPYLEQVRQPRFLPGGRQIVYDWVKADASHELKLSDSDGANFKKVSDLTRADYQIAVSPKKSEAVLFADNQVDPAEIVLYDLETGSARVLAEKAAWQGVKFSADGTRLLAARRGAGGQASLVILDLGSGAAVETGLAADIGAAAWLPNGAGIIAGMRKGFVRFTLASRESTAVFSAQNLVVRDMLIHPQEQRLFFVDGQSRALYELSF